MCLYEEWPSNNEPVKGTWTWTENGILFGITKDYTLTFTPENSDNFTQLSVNHDNIIVDVQPAYPNLTLTVDTAQQKPGGEVNVTVSASNPYNNDPDIQPEVEVVYQIADGEEKAVTGGKFIIPAGTAPGTEITITARVDGTDKKYVASTASASVTVVNEDTIFVTISGVEVNDKIYDGKKIEPSGAPVIKDESGNSVNAAVKNYIWADASGAKLEDAPVNKGTYTLTMKVEGYAVKNLPIKFEIRQATLTIAAENKAATKGGTIPELTYTMTSSGGTKPTLKTEPKLHCTATKDSVPGT